MCCWLNWSPAVTSSDSVPILPYTHDHTADAHSSSDRWYRHLGHQRVNGGRVVERQTDITNGSSAIAATAPVRTGAPVPRSPSPRQSVRPLAALRPHQSVVIEADRNFIPAKPLMTRGRVTTPAEDEAVNGRVGTALMHL